MILTHYAAREAGRLLRRNPGVTLMAVLALALGSGANSAIFSVAIVAAAVPALRAAQVARMATLRHE